MLDALFGYRPSSPSKNVLANTFWLMDGRHVRPRFRKSNQVYPTPSVPRGVPAVSSHSLLKFAPFFAQNRIPAFFPFAQVSPLPNCSFEQGPLSVSHSTNAAIANGWPVSLITHTYISTLTTTCYVNYPSPPLLQKWWSIWSGIWKGLPEV